MTLNLNTPGLVICTHPGKFHADDVFAVAFLRWCGVHPLHEIIRSSDPADIVRADIVLDVGGVYDPEIDRYDHHQRDFDKKREDGTPYAAFGLIVEHFGRNHLDLTPGLFEKFDKSFVRLIDGPDNGMMMHEGEAIVLARLVEDFMPSWDENPTPKAMDRAFLEAVDWAEKILYRNILRQKARLRAKTEIANVVVEHYITRPTGETSPETGEPTYEDKAEIIELTKFLPWQEYVCENYPDALVCVFPNIRGGYAVQVVPTSPHSYESHVRPPQEWFGLQNEALQEVTGVDDAVFCHANGFICAAATLGGAMEMAVAIVTQEVPTIAERMEPVIGILPAVDLPDNSERQPVLPPKMGEQMERANAELEDPGESSETTALTPSILTRAADKALSKNSFPGADPIEDPDPNQQTHEDPEDDDSDFFTGETFEPRPTVKLNDLLTAGADPDHPGLCLKTSPVVRNEGKYNVDPTVVARRIMKAAALWPDLDETTMLRVMMACCLPHAAADPEAVIMVLEFVKDNPGSIRVYDFPPRMVPEYPSE